MRYAKRAAVVGEALGLHVCLQVHCRNGHRCNEGDMKILNMAFCRKMWSASRHGIQAIKIWSALDNELVTVKMRITTYELYETHDGRIHKTLTEQWICVRNLGLIRVKLGLHLWDCNLYPC